jgi:acetoin utilization protein AcuB
MEQSLFQRLPDARVAPSLLLYESMSSHGAIPRVRQYPTVGQHMSASPRTISPRSSLASAHRLMRTRGIRHLPVVDRGVVVGIISARDLLLLETLPGVTAGDARVDEAMVRDVFVVSPETPLGEAVETMIERKIGSAVVVEGSAVVGVLTTIDALGALHELLEPPPAAP